MQSLLFRRCGYFAACWRIDLLRVGCGPDSSRVVSRVPSHLPAASVKPAQPAWYTGLKVFVRLVFSATEDLAQRSELPPSSTASHTHPAAAGCFQLSTNGPQVWPPQVGQPEVSSYSIKREFEGATVLITGASGYIGSVVLEQPLRTTAVGQIYLLLRPRRGQDIPDRADKLLQGAMFHKVRDHTALLTKVQVVGGDISLPGLGLSPADRDKLASRVNFIIHCAADIRLEADIQETLTSNYEGTRTVLQLAASAQCLRGLVHVSSAFVNMNVPRGSIIDEAIYPLRLGRQVVDVEQIAKELLESPKSEANQRAETYKQLWHFPNNYTMGKHMSEQLVTRYQAQLQLPVAIVRPSLTSAIAGEPYPGYVGNWAGPIGAAAAMAVGMFTRSAVWPLSPLVCRTLCLLTWSPAVSLAAAAAVSAGAAAAISHATQAGVVKGLAEEARVVLGYPHPFAAAATASHALLRSASSSQNDVTAKILTKAHSVDAIGVKAASPDVAVRQRNQRDQQSSPALSSDMDSPRLRAGPPQPAGAAVCSTSSSANSRSSSTVCELDAQQLRQQQGGMPLLVVHAATSSTYPLVLMEEGWNYMCDFLHAHPPPFRMSWGKLQRMTQDFEPKVSDVMSARRRVGWKVWGLAGLMRWLGKDKEARKLEVGFDAFCVQNNSKTDRQLVFATDALVALEAALDPSEASDYLLVWRPVTNSSEQQRSSVCSGPSAAAASADFQLSTVRTWRRFCYTQMAGVYKAVYGIEVPRRQLTAQAAAAQAQGKQVGQSEDDYMTHDFVRIR